jgi:protein SCO1/2
MRLSRRARIALVSLSLAALAATTVATLALRSGDDSGPAAEVTEVQGLDGPRSPFKGALRKAVLAPGFALRDQNGRLVRLARLRGKVVVLTPMYTHCKESCPLVAQQIRAAIDDLPASDRADLKALALSVDPQHDTRAAAREFIRTHQVAGYLDYLVGPARRLRPLWRSYGFAHQTEAREHNSLVVLIDRKGRQRVAFPVGFLTPESLSHDLRILLQ